MKILPCLLALHILLCCLDAAQIKKEGILPSYAAYDWGVTIYFLPYDPTVLIVGDQIGHLAAQIAQTIECGDVYCITPDKEELQLLESYGKNLPNIYPFFGLLHQKLNRSSFYYSVCPQELTNDNWFTRIPGSLFKPCDPSLPCLYGKRYEVPAFTLLEFRKEKKIAKIHFLHLNSGGNELQILQSDPKVLDHAIVVLVKTYLKPIRKNLSSFSNLHKYMLEHDYELMTHYIYDGILGDALYVKSKYLSAVFRKKEF